MTMFKIHSPMANTGKSILKDKSTPKSMFTSKSNPRNHADRVAVTAVKYTALFPFKLDIKNTINIKNAKNSKIVKTNPSISVAPKYRLIELIQVKYTTDTVNFQHSFIGADRGGKLGVCIYKRSKPRFPAMPETAGFACWEVSQAL